MLYSKQRAGCRNSQSDDQILLNNKLVIQWKGSFEILEKIGNNQKIVHINMLRGPMSTWESQPLCWIVSDWRSILYVGL